ncbi:YicC/YloC family endoribonuclease [Pollutimonas harenae]|uniref:YicC family protein n=1 Tax=Pollutimonas harenae TaxID=657015 RepID=A0A853H2B7_9BURK|nr:YicC/YloC family endoribonuclease [Pollutimonas harenae]NYT85949.1 YicC family protein [Pollutimonas harenae]TEA70999.1 YicC family protein [Pollutimonas harenae]
MIRSMTAFGNARAESPQGSVSIEFRTVNSRFLDVSFRLPDELRMAEGPIREQLGLVIKRGKVEIRANYARPESQGATALDLHYLTQIASQLEVARQYLPDVAAPRLSELLNNSSGQNAATTDSQTWLALCAQATTQALAELLAAREREGRRLADMMLACASDIGTIVNQVEADLPALLAEHHDKIASKLRDALTAASPDGFAQISGAELTARIAQEASLFSLRIDVAEELSRLRSHITELEHLLGATSSSASQGKKAQGSGSVGKRLDFLFQEMNREANTLGSKASAISVTRAAIDLKLLIEQMREQAQNIE